jgi:hypothetical protein
MNMKDNFAIQSAIQSIERGEPNGCCFYCGGPASQHHPIGPTRVEIMAPDDDEVREFCNWVCFGHWAAAAAGGVLVINRN